MIDCAEIELLTNLYNTWIKTIGIPQNKIYNPPTPQKMVDDIIESLKDRLGYKTKEGII